MAGTGGYFLQGLAGGLQTGFNMGQMKWQQNEKKKLEKKQNELMETASVFNNMVAQLGEDGAYSDDDMMKISTSYMALGYDVKERVDGTYKAIQAMDKKTIEANYQWFDFAIEATSGMKSGDAQGIFDTVRPFISGEKGLQTYAALESITKKKSEVQQAQPQIERFISPEGVTAKYPDAIPKHTAQGWIPEFEQPTEPQTELDKMEETKKWLDSAYATGNANYFNRVAKERGVPTTFDTYKQEYEKPEIAGEEGTPAPTSTENIRNDILQAPTLNDAKRIYKNFDDKYDITALGIPDVDKFWGDERVKRLDSLKTSIENLLVDRGDKGRWLKPGTVTSAEVGMEIEGDEQEAAIAYRDLRDEYMRFRDMLEKMGVDVSQYPKLKPLSEIEKVGGWEGAIGWGVKGVGFGIKKGDYKSIYY